MSSTARQVRTRIGRRVVLTVVSPRSRSLPSRPGEPANHRRCRTARLGPFARRRAAAGAADPPGRGPHGVLPVRQRGVDPRGLRGVQRRSEGTADGEASWRRARRAVRDDGHRPRPRRLRRLGARAGGHRHRQVCRVAGAGRRCSAGGRRRSPRPSTRSWLDTVRDWKTHPICHPTPPSWCGCAAPL